MLWPNSLQNLSVPPFNLETVTVLAYSFIDSMSFA